MKDNGFMLNYLDGLSYLCHKIILKRGASYIDSPDSLNCKEIEKNAEIITKIKTF